MQENKGKGGKKKREWAEGVQGEKEVREGGNRVKAPIGFSYSTYSKRGRKQERNGGIKDARKDPTVKYLCDVGITEKKLKKKKEERRKGRTFLSTYPSLLSFFFDIHG